LLTHELDLATVRSGEPQDKSAHRSLAGSRLTDDRKRLAPIYMKRHTGHGPNQQAAPNKCLIEAVNFQH
jgi:hypothetical protein